MEEKGQDWRELNGVATEAERAMHHWMDRDRPSPTPRSQSIQFLYAIFHSG